MKFVKKRLQFRVIASCSFRVSVTVCLKRYQVDMVSDPVVINSMMFLCKTIHDSVK